MKKTLPVIIILALALCFTLASCGEPVTLPQAESPEITPDVPDNGNSGSGSDDPDDNIGNAEKPETPPFTPPEIVSETHSVQLTAAANVRASASTSSAVLATLERWTIVPYISTDGAWRKIRYDGKTAYISANYSKIIEKYGAEAAIEDIIAVGKTKMGYPYVLGAPRILTYELKRNPAFTGKTFDCSSFVQYAYYIGAGIKLQGDTRSQYAQKLGYEVSFANLKRGDVMFFTNADRQYLTGIERIGHVAIYLGDNIIMHTYSPSVGSLIEPLSALRKSRFIAAKRYF